VLHPPPPNHRGTDVELAVLAASLRCAIVCVECARGGEAEPGEGRSPFYLALPADVAERKHPTGRRSSGNVRDSDASGAENGTGGTAGGGGGGGSLLRLGRYMPHGAVKDDEDADENKESGAAGGGSLVWSAARGKVRLRVRLVEAASAAASAAARGCGGGGGGGSGGGGSGEDVNNGGGAATKDGGGKGKGKGKGGKGAVGASAPRSCRPRYSYCLPALVVVHRPGGAVQVESS
jgi:hypothetical protein